MATVDSTIGNLPRATAVDEESLLVMEQQGDALAVTGKLIANFAKESVSAETERAADAANDAEKSATNALDHADRSETARDRAIASEESAEQSATDAADSAYNAKTSETNAARSEANAEEYANRAAAEAERVTVPAAVGVYNVVLTDRVTNERYALIVEDGRMSLLGVSETLDSVNVNLIDTATGTAYELIVESGKLSLKEV